MKEKSPKIMSLNIKVNKLAVGCASLLVIMILYLLYRQTEYSYRYTPVLRVKETNFEYTVWPRFDNTVAKKLNFNWFETKCMETKVHITMENLIEITGHWFTSPNQECKSLYDTYKAIFTVSQHVSKVVIPSSFAVKVRKWLGNNEKLFQSVNTQTVLFLFNEYTREENVFNPLRDKRPMSKPDKPERQYVNELAEETSKTCDFCKYKQNTAEDTFGRVESDLSFTAANTFKLDSWHTLILIKNHSPLDWNYNQFMDLMNTAQKWLQKAYDKNPIYKYPMLIWDLLPHAGASQVHPHVHAFLDTRRYQGAMENWRIGANLYTRDFPEKNYFTDLVAVHSALGLAVQYKSAVAFASLVPKKDNEVVVMCETASEDFFTLMYFVYRAFLDDMEKLCFSSGIALPSMDDNDIQGRLPAYARIVTRGAVADVRSDISSLELFTSPNANTDPYKTIKFVKESIEKRSRRT